MNPRSSTLIKISVYTLIAVLSTGCAAQRTAIAKNPVLKQHFAQDHIGEVTLVAKQQGTKKSIFGARPILREFLEGTITGAVTRWDGQPVEGVVVRVDWTDLASSNPNPGLEEELALEQGLENDSYEGGVPAISDASATESITDSAGIYRVRFSVPTNRGKVGLEGKMKFNPGWETQMKNLGRSYEPYLKETKIRLFYDKKLQTLAFSMGENRSVVEIRENSMAFKEEPSKVQATARPIPKKDESIRRSAQILGLQIILVQNKLENLLELKHTTDHISLTVRPERLFEKDSSVLKPEVEKGLLALAQWMMNYKKTVTLLSPELAPDLVLAQKSTMTNLLKKEGVGLIERYVGDSSAPIQLTMNYGTMTEPRGKE